MDGGVLFGMVVVAVLGLSTAQTKYCCTPDQWQGLMSITTGVSEREHGNLISAVSYLYYDYTNQRLASLINVTDSAGHVFSFKNLVLYSGPNWYSVQVRFKDQGSAGHKKYSAEKIADFTLGAATESLPVSFYSFKIQNTSLQVSLTVTRELCIPVSELAVGEIKEKGTIIITGFVDIQPGISDPSVFDVPPECKGAKPQYSHKMFPEALASFSSSFFNL
ncbi:hypothetical protein C0Q70_12435 [Pomacea canaliculata]|uniref:Uncharacterized protein n=1 Tax=Pomacea canaliculata TaxID=400727 RepID=A0A2T7P1K2_POMCA|nr:hypothetical protein C0Q70_12435 [Pomacea canaliculata]